MVVRLSALCTDHDVVTRKITGTHYCQRLIQPHTIHNAQPEGLGELKKSIYLIWIRTSDLPAYTIVPQIQHRKLIHFCNFKSVTSAL
jgi:hypothetical protein